MRRTGRPVRTARLEARFVSAEGGRSRIGIIVPRHRNSAVDRNRVKRRLRELVRQDLLPALRSRTPLDVVVRARAEAYRADRMALATDIRRLADQLAGSP